jgi:BlaI family penicillinase repressor
LINQPGRDTWIFRQMVADSNVASSEASFLFAEKNARRNSRFSPASIQTFAGHHSSCHVIGTRDIVNVSAAASFHLHSSVRLTGRVPFECFPYRLGSRASLIFPLKACEMSLKNALACLVYICKQYGYTMKRCDDRPPISDSEWKIMRLLWKKAPQPSYDIIQTLVAAEGWHPSTIKTLLGRLTRKRVVGTKKYKNLFQYRPLLSEEDCIHVESQSLLDRLFDGSVKPLLLHFARRKALTQSDLDELKAILEKRDDDDLSARDTNCF